MTLATARTVISPDLVQQHIDRAVRLMPDHDADGLLVFHKSNIIAFCGVPLAPSDRLVCGLINSDGRVAFVVPAFEAELAASLPPGSEVVTWEESDDPYLATAKAASLLGIDGSRILLDGHTWLDAQHRMQAALPRADLIADPGVIHSVRVTKSDDEIAAIRAACEATGRIYALINQRLRPGITETELARDVLDQLRKAGVSPYGELIQGGENASIPHMPTGQRRFINGDAVIVDFVAVRGSYHGDMTRTFAVGQPSEEVCSAYATVRAAQRAAIQAIRPGVTCEQIDQTARGIIERAGLGGFFSHRLGHGIGLDVHEPPYLVAGSNTMLKPGMCVTVEPGVYLPGRFGIRIEDVVVVTQSGSEVLSADVPTDVSEEFD